MKLSVGLAASALLSTAAKASAPVGHVYTYDPADFSSHAASSEPQSVSPETARLIFAQRLGISDSYSLQDASEREVQQINEFGDTRRQLLANDPSEYEAPRMFVLVDGVQDMNDIIEEPFRDHRVKTFTISDPPSSKCNLGLYEELESQVMHLPSAYEWRRKSQGLGLDNLIVVSLDDEPLTLQADVSTPNRITLAHSETLLTALQRHGAKSDLYKQALDSTRSHVNDLLAAAKRGGVHVTIAIMPYSTKNSKCYGAAPAKSKRGTPEAPLSADVKPSAILTDTTGKAPHTNPVDAASVLKGILPACFSSQSACETATLNCTGHGHCGLSHRDKDNADKACYSCTCTPTVRSDGDGKNMKTTRWGGPACQKKDVSMPFWLLGGFTVLFLFTVSWGIGLLYSMGEQELPSVIGAGVSGPRAK